MLCNNYQSYNLIGPYHFWGINPRNSTYSPDCFSPGGTHGLGMRLGCLLPKSTTCTHMHIYTYMHAHVHTHTRTRTHAHTHTRTHTRTHARTHTHTGCNHSHLGCVPLQDNDGPLWPHPLCDVCEVGRGGATVYCLTRPDHQGLESKRCELAVWLPW